MMSWSTRFRLTPRETIERRGYCTGPVDGGPAPGEVGLDYKAACCTCGRRVKVTVRGRYAHHRAPVESQKTAAEALLPELTTNQVASLRAFATSDDAAKKVHGHTIHSLQRHRLIAGRHRLTPLGHAVLAADRARIPDIFDDLLPQKKDTRP